MVVAWREANLAREFRPTLVRAARSRHQHGVDRAIPSRPRREPLIYRPPTRPKARGYPIGLHRGVPLGTRLQSSALALRPGGKWRLDVQGLRGHGVNDGNRPGVEMQAGQGGVVDLAVGGIPSNGDAQIG